MTLLSWLVVFVSVLVLGAVGHALVALLVRTMKLYWFERLALAFLIGTAAMSALWMAFNASYDVIPPVWLLSMLSLLILAASRSRLHGRTVPSGNGAASDHASAIPKLALLDTALVILLALEFGGLLLAAVHTPLGWDGLFNFELKARLIFENNPSGSLPIPYLSDSSRNWSHPQYPLLVPFTEFWIYGWLGRVDQSAIKILFPLFYFSLVGILCGVVRRYANARSALATGVAIGLLPPFTLLPGAASGYADVPLAAAVVGAISFGFIALNTRTAEAWTLAGVLLAIATWTKSEGIVLAGCVSGVGLTGVLWTRVLTGSETIPIVPALKLLWIPLAAAIPWLLVQQRYGLPPSDFVPLSAAALFENIVRLPAIVRVLVRDLLRPGLWGLIWPVWGLAIMLMLSLGRARAADWFLIGVVVLPLSLYAVCFTLSAWPDPLEHARWAFPRLLVPLAPAAIMFTVLTLSSEMRRRSS